MENATPVFESKIQTDKMFLIELCMYDVSLVLLISAKFSIDS